MARGIPARPFNCAKRLAAGLKTTHLVPKAPKALHHGGELAEWLRSGLQIRVHRFDSGTRLHLESIT